MNNKILMLACVWTLALLFPVVSFGHDLKETLMFAQAKPRPKLVDYGHLKRMVEQRFKGRVVNQELRRNATPPTYRFRLVRENGSVVDIVVNASTGEVMRVRG